MKIIPSVEQYLQAKNALRKCLEKESIVLENHEINESLNSILSESDLVLSDHLNEASVEDFFKKMKENMEKMRNYALAKKFISKILKEKTDAKVAKAEAQFEFGTQWKEEKKEEIKQISDKLDQEEKAISASGKPAKVKNKLREAARERARMEKEKIRSGEFSKEEKDAKLKDHLQSYSDEIEEIEEEIKEISDAPMFDWAKKSFIVYKRTLENKEDIDYAIKLQEFNAKEGERAEKESREEAKEIAAENVKINKETAEAMKESSANMQKEIDEIKPKEGADKDDIAELEIGKKAFGAAEAASVNYQGAIITLSEKEEKLAYLEAGSPKKKSENEADDVKKSENEADDVKKSENEADDVKKSENEEDAIEKAQNDVNDANEKAKEAKKVFIDSLKAIDTWVKTAGALGKDNKPKLPESSVLAEKLKKYTEEKREEIGQLKEKKAASKAKNK